MFILPGTVKVYVLLLSIIQFTTIQGHETHLHGFSEEDGKSTSYFFYQHPDYPKDCKDFRDRCYTDAEKSSGTYLIKPDGYTEPFEVYCNNDIDAGGWTVFLRRSDGSLSFTRNWKDFKVGFGFLSHEHWLGNEKLCYLTNQANYELRVDVILSNGSSFYYRYSTFRMSDEWSQYTLTSVGNYSGNASLVISECPPGMVYRRISCENTCDNPKRNNNCSAYESFEAELCVCANGFLRKGANCVHPSECGCFLAEANLVIPNNETYVNWDCSEKCTCQNGQLFCNSNYGCSQNAVCRIKDDVRQCYCNAGFKGDGETCLPLYKDCYDVSQAGHTQNGVYTIKPSGWSGSPFEVYCDMTTSNGGWTVFQRRVDGVTDFYRNWTSYRHGFGSVQHGNDFWLGNEQLYYLTNTNQRSYKLRVDIVTSGGSPKYDEYTSFRTEDKDAKYRLVDLGSHSGTAGDGMYYNRGRQFSTYDEDNDTCRGRNCADKHKGAWWHNPETTGWCTRCSNTHCFHFQITSSCKDHCTETNPNGDYNGGNGENIFWGRTTHYCNLNSVEMKIRPLENI